MFILTEHKKQKNRKTKLEHVFVICIVLCIIVKGIAKFFES